MKQSVGFIIVAYNPNKESLKKLQSSLARKPVTVVDNGKHNLGFGGGANVGIRQAVGQGAEWIVVLNQDTEMTQEATNALCRRLEQLPPCIAGPFTGSLDLKRWTTILGTGDDYVSGSCMAIHKRVIEKIGYFYEPYFMYYEDADLCVRAKNAGFPLKKLNGAGIEHSDRPVWGKGSRIHEYYLARNHLWFVWRLAPWNVKLYELIRLPKTLLEFLFIPILRWFATRRVVRAA